MMGRYKKIASNFQFNIIAGIVYIALILLLSPLFGINWFSPGDLSTNIANYYHVIMIPFTLLLMLIVAHLLKLSIKLRNALNFSNIPILVLTFFGLITYYPSSMLLINYALQAFRDIWVSILTIFFIAYLAIFPLTNRKRFSSVWGAYLLLFLVVASALISAMLGLIAAGGEFIGYNNLPLLSSYISSLNESSTAFIGNTITSHSHEMLPALMGGIIAIAAISFGYDSLVKWRRNLVNYAFLLGGFGVISMTYLYVISSIGTYVIPALFTSGSGGVNGLALDDMLTGIVGISALIALIGLFPLAISRRRNIKYLDAVRVGLFLSWIFAMIAIAGMGYFIEFNESFYGAGVPGAGPGYMNDLAFMNGHIIYGFFMLPILSTVLIFADLMLPKNNVVARRNAGSIGIAGMFLGLAGLFIYVFMLNTLLLEVGFWLMVITIAYISYLLYANHRSIRLAI